MPSVRAIRGRRRRTVRAAAALALAACLLSSCGDESDTGLSRERGADLRASLDRVEGDVSKGDCTGAEQEAGEFRREVTSLPARVDRDLRAALERSATRLESLVAKQCEPQPAAPVDEAPVEEQPPPDENGGDQQDKDKKDKKPKKPKGTTGQEGSTGVTGQEGSTGVTGQEGTTFPPEGG